jgi:hypothetical protein
MCVDSNSQTVKFQIKQLLLLFTNIYGQADVFHFSAGLFIVMTVELGSQTSFVTQYDVF